MPTRLFHQRRSPFSFRTKPWKPWLSQKGARGTSSPGLYVKSPRDEVTREAERGTGTSVDDGTRKSNNWLD